MPKRDPDQLGKAGVRSARRRAEEYAEDPQRARRLLAEAMKKANHRKGKLAEVWDALMALMRLIRAWVDGQYRDISWRSIVLAITAVLYFLMPFDLIPDWIVGMGFVDDAAVIAWVTKSIKDDLDAFKAWEQMQETQ